MAYANNLPQQEKDRLDMMHHLTTLRLDNRLHLAPIGQNPQRILDLGTGTGIWAIEMGEFLHASHINTSRLLPAALSLTSADFADRGCLPFCRSMNISFCH
jgi:methylase of polypeptide subunit release factors